MKSYKKYNLYKHTEINRFGVTNGKIKRNLCITKMTSACSQPDCHVSAGRTDGQHVPTAIACPLVCCGCDIHETSRPRARTYRL